MNPDTNRFEPLTPSMAAEKRKVERELEAKMAELQGQLLRPNGEPVPKHWAVFKVGEEVVIKEYTFRVEYIGETAILFEPVGPVVLDTDDDV